MSVLVKKLKSQTIEAYVKGAPEVMVDICTKESCEFQSPADFLPVTQKVRKCPKTIPRFSRITPSMAIE